MTNREWLVLSEAVFAREGYRCLSCRKLLPLTAHHVIPRGRGGPDSLENLVALCGGPGGCHERIQPKWKDYVDVFTRYLDGQKGLRPGHGAGKTA